ncbi:hypothetical protein ACVR1I_03045 [Streptococcus cameli]
MYNQKLLKWMKLLVSLLLAGIIFAGGYATSAVLYSMNQEKDKATQVTKEKSTQKPEDNSSAFNSGLVEQFLIAYFTKKDLGENQSRYKPFMTEGLYNATVSDEEKPIQQAYKGYVVDQVYESSKIYINEQDKTALVKVTFSSLLLEEKDNRDGGSITQQSTLDIRLSYIEQDGKYLVSTLDNLVVSDGTEITSSPTSDIVAAVESE